MATPDNDISYFARTNFRRPNVRFGIRQADRLSHTYIIGKTGVGKSTLLEVLARGDLEAGRGFALIDPHGDLVDRVYEAVPAAMRDRVVYLNAPDPSQPYGYNPLRRVRYDKIPLAASGLLETLRKLWPDAWGVRMEHVLRNTLYALLERDDSTLPDILDLYTDEKYRKRFVRDIRNEVVRDFWISEFEHYPARLRAEAVMPIQNKIGALLADPTLYRILVQPEQPLSFRSIMDEGRVILVNLAKGQLGEDSSNVLGGLIVSTLGLAAFSRADRPSEARRPFHLHIDEFQSFTTLSFVNMLSELRKYGVGLTLANQHLHQLDLAVQHAVFGNVGTLISFRVGPADAGILAQELRPPFGADDLLNLSRGAVYLRLMIDGACSRPFSGRIEREISQ